MDLLKLNAKIEFDDSEYKKGVQNAEKMGKNLQGKMSAMTVAVGNIAADMLRKGINGIKSVVDGAINGYADYQQLIGGVETLYKKSADTVARYAKQSFKTTGLSANDYMETVTSFSASLIQGLGGNTEKAAELANMAVTDMADNANKMGTDITMIQNAYQGFAKKNFMMLDNLKLGYGGTASEMVRLVNDSKILDHEIKNLDDITFDQLVEAIHKIQTEMGITGTTAKEAAETISGSKASLKAAWTDLLTAVGGEGDQATLDRSIENFKTSFSTYMENFIPTLATTITNSGSLVEAIAESIASLPTNLLAEIGEKGLGSGTQMVGGAGKIVNWLIDSITNVFKSAKADPSKAAEFGKAIGSFIGDTLTNIADSIPDILDGMINAGVALAGGLVEGLFKGLFGEGAEVDEISKQLQKDITEVDVNSAKASALVQYIQGLVDKFGDGVEKEAAFQQAVEELKGVMPEAGEVFESYGEDIQGAINQLDTLIQKMKQTSIMAGMTKALNMQYSLLGEQQVTKAQADNTADMYRAEKQGLEATIKETAKAYAAEVLRLDKENGIIGMDDRYGELMANARQTLETGETGNLAQLVEALQNAYDRSGAEGVDTLWGKSETDDILSPEQIESFNSRIAEFEVGIEDALKASQDAQKEIDATNKAIAETERAVNAAMEQSFGDAAGKVSSGGAEVGTALNNLAGKINSFKVYGGVTWMPRAVGMDYVPRNGLRAELHEGEAILTKKENEERRKGIDSDELATIMEDTLIDALSKVGIYMGRDQVGNLTTARVNANITRETRSRQTALGG